jgi:4-amino-4-deoxy-L-arabinose transferase-like glycosyltransferase
MAGLLTARELQLWSLAFLTIAVLLVATSFASDDPDSALYATLSARLADGPPARWIAPEWGGQWEMEGLFREHPAGVFLLPTLLGAAGVPTVQAAYIVGIAAGLAALLLVAYLVSRLTSREDGRLILVLLQLMPMASIFRIRANHEYPMLVCLLVALIGIDAARRSWRWWWVTPAALTAALLVKGVFVAIPLIAVGLWMAINPLRVGGPARRGILTAALGLVALVATALVYDRAYVAVTGEPFWGLYWQRQLSPLDVSNPMGGESTFAAHAWFYLVRMAWHPAPWSLALVVAAWQGREGLAHRWRSASEGSRRGLIFTLAFAGICVLLLSPASRFAERYTFSANYAIAAAGAIVAARLWPSLPAAVARLDRAVPAFPAACWTALMLLRLVLGPHLPRVSS